MKLFDLIKQFCRLLVLFAFSSNSFALELQANGIYDYDLNANSLVVEKIDVRYQKHVYDGGCNFIHCGVEQPFKFLSEKAHDGPFFAFEAGLVATKGSKMPTGDSQVKHIFDSKKVNDGHIAPKTNASQKRAGKMFENVTANPANKRPDLVTNPHQKQAGIEMFTKTQNNGQIWVQSRKGVIQDAGVNRKGKAK